MIEHAGDILLAMACGIMGFFALALMWDLFAEWWHGDTEGDDEPDNDEGEPR